MPNDRISYQYSPQYTNVRFADMWTHYGSPYISSTSPPYFNARVVDSWDTPEPIASPRMSIEQVRRRVADLRGVIPADFGLIQYQFNAVTPIADRFELIWRSSYLTHTPLLVSEVDEFIVLSARKLAEEIYYNFGAREYATFRYIERVVTVVAPTTNYTIQANVIV